MDVRRKREIQSMIDKEKILESWIMVEHLSEGNIKVKDKFLLTFDNLKDQDFYSLFRKKIENHKFKSKQQGGIAVFFDIFNFDEVISVLRERFGLQPSDEDIRIGDKFSFVLYFDKLLNLEADRTFFTESAYIRYYKEVIDEKYFRTFEEGFREQITQDFDDTSEQPDKFNEAFQKVMGKYGIPIEKCRVQIINNMETDATQLHSFFIDDLEKAKKISTQNLKYYLYGEDATRHINLDSKYDSDNFNPGEFKKILQPQNYPLGRFPSNTKFSLSLMQEVAVNLSIGYDNKQMRSVNGPPGTGKTTLLKDIFAELIVQQAYDIAQMSNHFIKGTNKMIYYNNASIGELPKSITEKSIVVASSNNGAVQNIVNELPLIDGIDEKLKEEIINTDYFTDLSNSELSAKWLENEDGHKYEKLNVEPNKGEKKFWGLFSLEGGKSENVTKVLTSIKHILKYFEEEYSEDISIYKKFTEQFNQVKKLRDEAQKWAKEHEEYEKNCNELFRRQKDYKGAREQKVINLNNELMAIDKTIKQYNEGKIQLENELKENEQRKTISKKNQNDLEFYYQELKEQKPGFFTGRKRKNDFKCKIEDTLNQLKGFVDKCIEYDNQSETIKEQMEGLQNIIDENSRKRERCQKEFDAWDLSEVDSIDKLIQKVADYNSKKDNTQEKPLDMNQDYDTLQLSNPWFDEQYRIAQSKLFITALSVRKQFLYENRKNIKAAVIIWGKQKEYLDKKNIIVAAWQWINMTIPVISSTFSSFSRMCNNLGEETIGHLFIDEAGQALPQASVGAIYRSKHVMAVGDPSQIKPVLTLDSSILSMLGEEFKVGKKYLSDSASTQTLMDAASNYGFYRGQDKSPESWIGIPLWVHRRCQYPMFTISNVISYNGFMVQGMPGDGKTCWYDVSGKANNKYVEEQGRFLLEKIKEMMESNPAIKNKQEKDIIYVISPFANVAYMLSQKLKEIDFTRYDDHGKPTNVGTIHTFQGKEAPIVFLVLGADGQSRGAAKWAVAEPNMMNVAATRAKKEFYVIGDKKLYLGLGCDVATDTCRIIDQYKKSHPDLVQDEVQTGNKDNLEIEKGINDNEVPSQVTTVKNVPERVTGKVKYIGKGKISSYAYITGEDGIEYSIPESAFSETEQASKIIKIGKTISFVPVEGKNKPIATDIKSVH